MANFINAEESREIVFTRNATEAINLVAYSWGLDNLRPQDEVYSRKLLLFLILYQNRLHFLLLSSDIGNV